MQGGAHLVPAAAARAKCSNELTALILSRCL